MINVPYQGPQDLPDVIPLFPLGGALLLPRGQLPLNIFEPRYMTMVDDVLRSHRLIGMIQPQDDEAGSGLYETGCVGRITQLQETGDGRYNLTLTGVARFQLREEMAALTPYRQGRVDYAMFSGDFQEADDTLVDRDGVLRALRQFAKANRLRIDWKDINEAPNEALVNALAMMSPFGIKEKQALLEAGDLKTRADVLIAITEMDLARGTTPHSTMQ